MRRARYPGLACLMVAACGGGTDGGDDDATPILELTPRVSRTCTVPSPPTMIDDGLALDFGLATSGETHYVATTRSDATVALSELDLEPVALGAPVWSTETSPQGGIGRPILAPRDGGGVAIAWTEAEYGSNPGYRLAIAVVDDSGTPVGAVSYVESEDEIWDVQLVARPGGYAIAWSGVSTLQLALLDPTGAPTGSPVTIATGASLGGHLVRHGAGFAVAWVERTADDEQDDRMYAVLLDDSGAARSEPRLLDTVSDRSLYGVFVTSVGDEVLVVWEENYFPEETGDEGGHTIVRVARLGASGELVGPVLRLQDPEPGFVNVNPTVLSVPGAVALSWSRGDFIAICGGCVSDNRMHLVLLDPVDLAPVSNIVELVGDAGLRSAPITSADGADIAYLLAIDRHARFDLAGAMVRCEPPP